MATRIPLQAVGPIPRAPETPDRAEAPGQRNLMRVAADLRRLAAQLVENPTIQGAVDAAADAGRGSVVPLGPMPGFRDDDGDGSGVRMRAVRAPLPDPRLVRRIIRHRQLRLRFFDAEVLADPAWNMLLDLAAARAEYKRVSITSLSIASGAPSTTALRWIRVLIQANLVMRIEDDTDRRRAFVQLTDMGADAMARYFIALGADAVDLI